jgi:hypothetical protein
MSSDALLNLGAEVVMYLLHLGAEVAHHRALPALHHHAVLPVEVANLRHPGPLHGPLGVGGTQVE